MMGPVVALIGADHGFDDSLDGYLQLRGIGFNPFDTIWPGLPEHAAIAILSDGLEGSSVFELLDRLRAMSEMPCIVVLPRGQDDAKRIMALELGADDCINRGAGPREVLAHIRAVLRRQRAAVGSFRPADPAWQLCSRRRELFDAEGAPRGLTASEFELLRMLVQADGLTLARDELCRRVFGRNHSPEDRAVDNLVVRLRRKVEPDPRHPQLIKSARPVGYFFAGFPAERQLVAAD